MEKLKIVQIGCGKMSKYIMRYAYEKGAEIVGAFDIDENIIGSDIGNIMESEEKNIVVLDISNLDEKLKELKPDVAIITTMSFLKDIHELLRICARNGINTITTCEEAFFPSISNPKIYKEIDVLAKANNCTITGCGYQDVFWGNLITTLASSTHEITKIKGSSSYNVEDYGYALARAHGAGLTIEEFNKEIVANNQLDEKQRNALIENGQFSPSYMWNTVGWIADKMGLEIISIEQTCSATTYPKDLHSETLRMNIKKGDATGMSAKVIAKTKEGIEIEAECIGKVYGKEEFDKNEWTVYGNPDTTLTINRPKTVELTCADIVNRIPDLIACKKGFIPTSQMVEPKYKHTF